MTPASAESLARRLHRYDLEGAGEYLDRGSVGYAWEFSAGYPYLETVEQVAAIVGGNGGSARQVMAAWLHGVHRVGILPRDLAADGVPAAVIDIIEAVSPRSRRTPVARHAGRVRACPGASLVLRAIVSERHRRLGRYDSRLVRRDRELLELTGVALPAELVPADPTVLLARIGPEHPDRFRALRALVDVGEPAVVRPLVDACRAAYADDPHWGRGVYLGRYDYHLVRMLSDVIRHPRQPDDPGLIEVLLELAGDGSGYLRRWGIVGLSLVPEYLPLVEQALDDKDQHVQAAAVRSLPPERLPAKADQLAVIAQGPERGQGWGELRGAAIQRLLDAGDRRARDLLLAAIASGRAEIDPKSILNLARQGDPDLIALLIRVVREHGHYHAVAASILGKLRVRDAVPAMVHYLDTQDYGPHDVYLRALGQIADPAAVPAIERIWRAQHQVRRVWALRALARFDDPRVTEIAMEAAGHCEPSLHWRAIRVLAQRGDERATMCLVAACDGPLVAVALKGLIRLGDERALPALTRLLDTATDRKVLHLAGRAMVASKGTGPVGLWLEGKPLPQLRATIWVRGEIGTPVVPHDWLLYCLFHHDELVRARAAAAIGKCGTPDSAARLSLALADISPRVRANAATALGRVASAKADPAEDGKNSDIRPQARDWLSPLLEDPHPSVRMATVAALRRLPR